MAEISLRNQAFDETPIRSAPKCKDIDPDETPSQWIKRIMKDAKAAQKAANPPKRTKERAKR